jgi:hypothetical protein
MQAEDCGFKNLVKQGGLDPKQDFQWRDLSLLDFENSDLRGYSFKGAVLDYSILTHCIIDNTTDFAGASTRSTQFPWSTSWRGQQSGKRFYIVIFIEMDTFFMESVKAKLPKSFLNFEFHRANFDDFMGTIGALGRKVNNEKAHVAFICIDNTTFFESLSSKFDGASANWLDVFSLCLLRKSAREVRVQVRNPNEFEEQDRRVLDSIKTAIEESKAELRQL